MLRSMSQMDRIPLNMAILGLQKNSGAIGDEAGAPLEKGNDGPICPQSDRFEGTCCFLTCVDNGDSLVRDCGLNPQQFHTGTGRNHNFGRVRGAKDGEGGTPPRPAVLQDTRAVRFRHHKVKQETSAQQKAHESYDRPSGASSGSLECLGAFHKTGCVAARCSNRGEAQFGPTRDLAVGDARWLVRPSPEYRSVFGEVRHSADIGVVAGRIDAKGETAEGQEPWLRAEEPFFHDFSRHRATTTGRVTRTTLATPRDERAIPLQPANVPVLNPEWIKGRLNPATLERLMQVWGRVGRSPFPLPSSGKEREGSRRIPVADARLLREAEVIENASSTTTGGCMTLFGCGEENHRLTTKIDCAATRQKQGTTLMKLFFLFYTFSIICHL
ncbi:hypothetical protein MOQ_005937 [Trypanosoma cruzi marinkellei]|uniref:Uncharacterized protein n=1 Tax=Trypanosoma cruzi marinkellei TaxID=85056 RepID=K2N6H5_TRYCR|nr:hypothetical protein MOQ_005937 [Trypanosoma cruzi marinkellei]